MIFTTVWYYVLFLLPAAAIFRVAPNSVRAAVLPISGIAFFSYFSYTEFGGWRGVCCLLLLLWEAAFSRLYRPGSVVCLIGIGQAILILFVFKYFNFVLGFFPATIAAEYHWAGAFLPLGLSFFTFEFIHYAADRYRGRAERGTIGDYLCFILFFPTLVAGPIKRYQDFVPKLHAQPRVSATDIHAGVTRILTGLAKKFCIADMMTALTVNLRAETIQTAPRAALLLWILAYGIQIYFDFSGYSDIAIGSARLFGIRVPENFHWPYFQRNISLFWTNWHISLSSWLRDYVYFPLGGSRGMRQPRVVANIMATMLVSGVWHGAGLNFIAWGVWHGAMLSGLRLWRSRFAEPVIPGVAGAIISWAITFALVTLGWAFFCMDIHTALLFFSRLAGV